MVHDQHFVAVLLARSTVQSWLKPAAPPSAQSISVSPLAGVGCAWPSTPRAAGQHRRCPTSAQTWFLRRAGVRHGAARRAGGHRARRPTARPKPWWSLLGAASTAALGVRRRAVLRRSTSRSIVPAWDVDLDQVALLDQRDRAAVGRFGRDVADRQARVPPEKRPSVISAQAFAQALRFQSSSSG